MPGHIFQATCACGFRRELQPGATITELFQIAYSANGADIITIDSREAGLKSLVVIEDPWLVAEQDGEYVNPPWEEGWWPYRCPACGENKLRLLPAGVWD